MTVARFWAFTGKEILITRRGGGSGAGGNPDRGGSGHGGGDGGGGGWTGRGGGRGPGGGGPPISDRDLNMPEVEVVTIPGGQANLDILTINSVAVSNFRSILGYVEAMSTTGSPTILAIRVSDDGGTTWDVATTWYRHTYISGAEVLNWAAPTAWTILSTIAATGNAAMFGVHDLNSIAPLTYESAEMSPVSNGDQKQWQGLHFENAVIDAIQLLVLNGTAPTMSGGTVRLMGLY